MSIITLTTDFGIKDFNVSIFKGLLNIELDNPKIIDISHEISPFNIIEGAYVMKNAYQNFPRGSIHIINIDARKYYKIFRMGFMTDMMIVHQYRLEINRTMFL